jgi:hypothetical protein
MINARRIIVTLQLEFVRSFEDNGATAAVLRAAVTPLIYNRRRGLVVKLQAHLQLTW